MFDTVRNNSPDALELKCIEVNLHIFHINFIKLMQSNGAHNTQKFNIKQSVFRLQLT